MNAHLAIDIGASPGRHIVGWREEGKLQTREVYRFPNGVNVLPWMLCGTGADLDE